MINVRNANSKDNKELARIQLGKVMFKMSFVKCGNCGSSDMYRIHEDKSTYCWTCSERTGIKKEKQEEVTGQVKDMRPRLVKKGTK